MINFSKYVLQYFLIISVIIHFLIVFISTRKPEYLRVKKNFIEFQIKSPINHLTNNDKPRTLSHSNINPNPTSTHLLKKTNSNPIRQLNHLPQGNLFQLSGKSASQKGARDTDPQNQTLTENQVHAHKWAQSFDYEQTLKIEPFSRQLGNRIASELHYLPELIERNITGSVSVEISTDKQGILTQMNITSPQAIPDLQGLVLTQIKKALADPLPVVAPTEIFKIAVSIDFQIVHTRFNQTVHPVEVVNNEIKINILEHKSASYDITELGLEDNIFVKIFGKKKPNEREWYDFKVKTRRLAWVCEQERVEDVCIHAAENYLLLGELNDSERLLKLGCESSKNSACQKLGDLIAKKIKSNQN